MSVKLTNSKNTDYHMVKMMWMRRMNQNQKHDVRENDDDDDDDDDDDGDDDDDDDGVDDDDDNQ